MNDIIEPTIDYDFSNLYLGPPSTIAGGAYFTRIMYNNNKQLYIQTPKSLTKQAFVKSGKKIYVDLMFDNNDTVFINWIENLEAKLDKDDIESAFTSPLKIYKSGKFYLLRVNVKPNIKIFNDDTNIINLDDLTSDKTLISIIEIQGIKFSSRNFQIEIELKQSMVVSPDPFLDSCFIKKPIKKKSQIDEDVENVEIKELDDLEDVKDVKNLFTTSKQIPTPSAIIDLNVQSFSNMENDNKVDIDIDIDKKTEINTAINSKTNSNITSNFSTDVLQLGDITDLNLNSDSENIVLEIEDLTSEPVKIEDPNILKEFDLETSLENNLESITLKKPNQVYYEIYKKAREKAKEAKKEAILAFLEAKNIKKTYMLDDIDESDSDTEDFGFNEIEDL